MSNPFHFSRAIILIIALGLAGCDPTTSVSPGPGIISPTTQPPVYLTSTVSASPLQTSVGTNLATPLSVRVTDKNFKPVAGTQVVWTVQSGNSGSVNPSVSTTDSSGNASTSFTAGSTVGTASVQATVSQLTPISFAISSVVGPPAFMTLSGGNNQNGIVGTPLGAALSVTVLDASGNGVPNVSVTWQPVNNQGILDKGQAGASQTVPTNSQGVSSTSFTLGTTTGNYTVLASASGLASQTFSANGQPNATRKLSVTSGNNQSVVVGATPSRFSLVATLTDGDNNPVSAESVQWYITSPTATGGGTIASTYLGTGDSQASAVYTTGCAAGQVNIVAWSPQSNSVTFSVTQNAGSAYYANLSPGNSSIYLATSLSHTATLVGYLTDYCGNLVTNAPVTWSISRQDSSPPLSLNSTLTNSSSTSGTITVNGFTFTAGISALYTAGPFPSGTSGGWYTDYIQVNNSDGKLIGTTSVSGIL